MHVVPALTRTFELAGLDFNPDTLIDSAIEDALADGVTPPSA
jgi:hypothetical protein